MGQFLQSIQNILVYPKFLKLCKNLAYILRKILRNKYLFWQKSPLEVNYFKLLPHLWRSILHQENWELSTSLITLFTLCLVCQVRDGLDHLLFNLLILGGLCNSHGKAWKRKPQDLYVIEITDFALQHRHSRVSRNFTHVTLKKKAG